MRGCTKGPIANVATTETSMIVRAFQIGRPNRSCRPTISPSRGPVP